MRATLSISWLLLSLSLGMCSTSTSTALVTSSSANTSTGVTTTNPTTTRTAVSILTSSTNMLQTTTTTATTEAINSSKSSFSTTSQQTTTSAATTATTVTSSTTNKPESTLAPTTGTKCSLIPASTSADHQPTGTSSFSVASTTTSQSRTTAQITPTVPNKSPVQTTSKSPPPNPSDVTKSPSADYSSKGPNLSTVSPTSSQTTERTSTKIIQNIVTKNQKDSLSGTWAEALSSPETRTTMKTNFVVATPRQTKTGPPNSGTLHTTAGTTFHSTITTNPAQQNKFTYSLLSVQETANENRFPELCQKLMLNWQNGTCILTWRSYNNKVHFDSVEINGQVKTNLAEQYYEEMTKVDVSTKPTDYKTLIAILASCGALLIMIIILTVCASHHRKPCNENQQYLTEELHTVENCYHDNPTLDVMEAQPEMQEKKVALNGEFNDSWIVPMDNLMKEDVLDEEDTHL